MEASERSARNLSKQSSVAIRSDRPAASRIENAIAARMRAADKDGDNELNQAEIESLVKDLIYEDRSNRRLIKVVIASMLLLLLSLVANFGLLLWAQELSKESHVAKVSDTMSASSVTRRRALLGSNRAADLLAKLQKIRGTGSAMTSTDRLSIVETQEATQKLPLFVMPNLEAANDPLSTPIAPRENRIKSISFDVYDYEQKSSPGLDGIPKPPVKTKTMAVEEVERLSPTHMIFKGKDGESVEIKDGKACATKQKAELNAILDSPAFAGSKLAPKLNREAAVGRTKPPAGMTGPAPRSYSTPDIKLRSSPLTQPICGAPMATVSSSSISSLEEIKVLEKEAVDRLEQRGIDMKERLAEMRKRVDARQQEIDARLKEINAGGRRKLVERPLTPDDFAQMAKPPASFDRQCGDAVQQILVPAVRSLSDARRKVNKDAEAAQCDRSKNPACFPCTDSTLGCQPIKLEHQGRLADLIQKRKQIREAKAARSVAEIQPTQPSSAGIPPPTKMSTLFVSEPIGNTGASEEADNTEVFIADEGICGAKAKGDATKAIRALAFKGCASNKWSDFMGVEGRALEMKAKRDEAAAGQSRPDNAFGFQSFQIASPPPSPPPPSFATPSPPPPVPPSALAAPTGLEDLPFEWVDEGPTAFNGFSAQEANGIGSLSFTRAANYTVANDTENAAPYVPKAMDTVVKMGDGGGADFPLPRFSPSSIDASQDAAQNTPPPVATLGTRLVGVVVKSDASLKSLNLIYKDDCANDVEQLDSYAACQNRVKEAQETAPPGRFPTEEYLEDSATSLSATPKYYDFPPPSPPPAPPLSSPPPSPPLANEMLGGDFSQDLAANVERDSRDSQGGSLSGEIIALIVAASVSVVGALGVIFYFYYRRRGGAHRRDPSKALPLATGWEEREDPAAGVTYYYNTTTGETSWIRPTE